MQVNIPINVLPIYEKVLEIIVKEQVELHLESNDLITENQSGFRKQHSCETAIQMIIDDWKLIISEDKMIGVVFMDLKRTFETINRERLVKKLYQYGIRRTKDGCARKDGGNLFGRCCYQRKFYINCKQEGCNQSTKRFNLATQLLQHARQSRNICTSQQASTSSIQQTSTASLDTAVECAEGTHAWTKQETLLLLGLYREHQEKFVGGKDTIKKHWDTISQLVQERHYISGFKCSTKLQALKRTYKSIMDHNNKTGNNRKDWEYLQIMQELFDEKPWMQPMAVAGSYLNENENAIDLDEDKENLLEKDNCHSLKRQMCVHY
ncbi:uncharacterized protein LOC112588408 [Harpegnathos saltator]|uniref:uncharacterized protein LOC112588408 n=1 Tax=Harpegnathos saltator TaxID=610380 RepID=UPI000DBEF1C6|nr:uncharacterized protein LOC112588408 [Harpegnathos saltator]